MKKILALVVLAGGLFACFNSGSSKELKIAFDRCDDNFDQVVATMGDKKVTLGDIIGEDRSEYYEARAKLFEYQESRLKEYVSRTILEQEAGSSDPAKVQEFVEKKIVGGKASVSDKEVQEFAKSRNIPADRLNDNLKGRIKEFLLSDKKSQLVNDYVAGKVSGKEIKSTVCKPSRPRFDVAVSDELAWGDKDAPVKIVEFSDFQCPYCAQAANGAVKEIKKHYGKSKVKIVFEHYPLPFHKDAPKASEAALCAGDQGKFWEFHDGIFADNSKIKVDDLKALAKKLKLDTAKFDSCLDGGSKAAEIQKDVQFAESIKGARVQSTPTFFINGIMVAGALPFEEFKKIIDEELDKK